MPVLNSVKGCSTSVISTGSIGYYPMQCVVWPGFESSLPNVFALARLFAWHRSLHECFFFLSSFRLAWLRCAKILQLHKIFTARRAKLWPLHKIHIAHLASIAATCQNLPQVFLFILFLHFSLLQCKLEDSSMRGARELQQLNMWETKHWH